MVNSVAGDTSKIFGSPASRDHGVRDDGVPRETQQGRKRGEPIRGQGNTCGGIPSITALMTETGSSRLGIDFKAPEPGEAPTVAAPASAPSDDAPGVGKLGMVVGLNHNQ